MSARFIVVGIHNGMLHVRTSTGYMATMRTTSSIGNSKNWLTHQGAQRWIEAEKKAGTKWKLAVVEVL
jgi:hypothetical protein